MNRKDSFIPKSNIVNQNETQRWAQLKRMMYVECSALADEQVDDIFDSLVDKLTTMSKKVNISSPT